MTNQGLPPLFGAPWERQELQARAEKAYSLRAKADREARAEKAYSLRAKADREARGQQGRLPPLFGAPWEREEPERIGQPTLTWADVLELRLNNRFVNGGPVLPYEAGIDGELVDAGYLHDKWGDRTGDYAYVVVMMYRGTRYVLHWREYMQRARRLGKPVKEVL